MGMPTLLTVAGTGTSAIWQPDWMQTPFSVSFGAIVSNGAGFQIEACMDNLDLSGLGTSAYTAGNATFFTVLAAAAANATGVISSPVTGLRVRLVTAGGVASSVAVNFMQATFGR